MAAGGEAGDLDARWTVVGVLAVLALYGIRVWPALPSVVDDAWISARYARNVALGHGFVYNAGEPAVEGFTNLAFVVLLAGLHAVGVDMHAAMVGSGVVFGALALVAIVALGRRLGGGRWAIAPALVYAADPHPAVVASNGIESSMFVAAVVGGCWLAMSANGGGTWSAGFLLGLISTIRPEGIAVAGWLALADLWARRGELRRPESWALALGVAAVSGPLWAWRRATFGAWLPNTWHAKAHRTVAEQVWFDVDYLRPDAPYWIGLAVVALVCLAMVRRRDARVVLATAAGIALIAFQVDMWMPGGRLLQPAVACVLAVAAVPLARLAAGDAWRRAVAAGLVLAAIAPMLFGPLPAWVYRYDWRHTALPGRPASEAAAFVGRHLPPGSVLATRDAGVVAYFVGPHVSVAEIHDRALTRPHVDGRDADVRSYTPKNPELFVATVQRADQKGSKYGGDNLVFRRMDAPYRYLGRVEQHYHRYYDFYVRADLDVPELPAEWVLNHDGPPPRKVGR